MSIINGVGRVGIRNYVSPIPQVSTLINGLVGYWNANGNANDSIGTNNGTLTNGATTNGTAKLGSNSFSFDGVNDYVAMSSATAWNFTTDFSVGFWIKPNNVTSQQMLVNNFQYQGGSFKGWDIRIHSSGRISATIWGSSGGLTYLSNTSLTISTWTYVEVIYKRGVSIEFRINGISDATTSTTEVPLYATNTIPCFGFLVYALGTGYAFNGLMDSIALWNRATTLTESTELYTLTTELQATYTTRTAAFATATGITDTTILNALNTFDTGLISNGLATKMKALYPFVGGTSATHKFNFMDARDLDVAYRLSFNGGWVHSNTGAKGNGTNTYANTFLNALTSISPSDNSFSIYKQLTETKNENYIRVGWATNGGTGGESHIMNYSPWTSFSSSGTADQAIVGSGKGMYVVSRNLNNLSLFKNTTKTLTTNTYKTHPNATYIIGNGNDYPQYVMNNALSFIHIGNGLTDTDASNLYTLTQALQTSLSRAV